MTNNHITKDELSQFVLDNQNKFYRIAFSYVKNKEAAMDVIQDAVVNAFANYDSLKQPEYLKTWFYRILINSAITYLRKNKKYVLTEDFVEILDSKEKVNDNDYIDLYNAVKNLPPKLKTVVILRYFEDMKFSDIALITKTNESTIKTRLKTALQRLSKFV